ncbi:MAG: FAD-dependent oxidoreductase, partial [Stackebrandtia sp.]
LRKGGYAGRITVLHRESVGPYNRTLVNKAVMQGMLTPDQIALPPLDTFEVEAVQAHATGIDHDRGVVTLDIGDELPYTALIAATGSAPQSGGRDDRVFHIHTVDDAIRVRDFFDRDLGSAGITVLGAGFIGSETASHFAGAGAAVNLVSKPDLPLASALGGQIAHRVAELHGAHVNTYFGRRTEKVDSGQSSVMVTLDDGRRLESDAVVIAHGTRPISAWAVGGGAGIEVDDRLRSRAVPNGYAAGSVAVHSAAMGARYRIDHWDAAVAQGTHAARAVLHDLDGAADPGPYAPTTGFNLNLYRTPITVYGPILPNTTRHDHVSDNANEIVTTFQATDGSVVAVAGFNAARRVIELRGQLARP